MGISKQFSDIITTNEERSICVQTDIECVSRNISVNENQDKLLNLQIRNTKRVINDRILFNK